MDYNEASKILREECEAASLRSFVTEDNGRLAFESRFYKSRAAVLMCEKEVNQQGMGVKELFERAKAIRSDATSVSVDYNDYRGDPFWTFWIHYGDRECLQGDSPEQVLLRLSATVEETTPPSEIRIELAEKEYRL